MSAIVCGSLGLAKHFAVRVCVLSAAALLALGSTACTSSSTARDAQRPTTTTQTLASAGDSNGPDSARSDDRSVGSNQVSADRTAKQAERSDGTGSGPYPLPWEPSPRGGSGGGTTRGVVPNPGANQRVLRVGTPSSTSQR